MSTKIASTKAVLAGVLERLASRVLCRIDPGRLDHRGDWSSMLADVRQAFAVLGDEDRFWRLARSFGFTPTILYVHANVTCWEQPVFTKEDTAGLVVTCPTCLRAIARVKNAEGSHGQTSV